MEEEYNKGFKIDELFNLYSSGVTTFKDNLAVGFTSDELAERKQELIESNEQILRARYNLIDTRDWKLVNVIKDLIFLTSKGL